MRLPGGCAQSPRKQDLQVIYVKRIRQEENLYQNSPIIHMKYEFSHEYTSLYDETSVCVCVCVHTYTHVQIYTHFHTRGVREYVYKQRYFKVKTIRLKPLMTQSCFFSVKPETFIVEDQTLNYNVYIHAYTHVLLTCYVTLSL